MRKLQHSARVVLNLQSKVLGRNLGYSLEKHSDYPKVNGYNCEPLPEILAWVNHIHHIDSTLSEDNYNITVSCCGLKYPIHPVFFGGDTWKVAKYTRQIMNKYLKKLLTDHTRARQEEYEIVKQYILKRRHIAKKEYEQVMRNNDYLEEKYSKEYTKQISELKARYNNLEENNEKTDLLNNF